MCEPISATTAIVGMAATTAATTAATVVAERQQAIAQRRVTDEQSEIRGKQIQAQAGQQESQAAMAARSARARSIAAASGAGVNLGSQSFMASLQTTTMNQYNAEGLIVENEQNQQQANTAETQSILNSKATMPTFMGGLLDVGLSAGGAYMQGESEYNLGSTRRSNGYDPSLSPG